jgi:hypothetical protein
MICENLFSTGAAISVLNSESLNESVDAKKIFFSSTL